MKSNLNDKYTLTGVNSNNETNNKPLLTFKKRSEMTNETKNSLPFLDVFTEVIWKYKQGKSVRIDYFSGISDSFTVKLKPSQIILESASYDIDLLDYENLTQAIITTHPELEPQTVHEFFANLVFEEFILEVQIPVVLNMLDGSDFTLHNWLALHADSPKKAGKFVKKLLTQIMMEDTSNQAA